MKILHLIDSLNPGGAERMAVGYVNALVEREFEIYLWSSREEGLLKNSIHPWVNYYFLNRRGPIGIKALREANRLIKKEKIQLIHAHSTSWFFGSLLKWLNPKVKLIWHDHYGSRPLSTSNSKKSLIFCSRFFDTVFTVNQTLKDWHQKHLKTQNIFYIPNFVTQPSIGITWAKTNSREHTIVCVANLRVPKNHINLITAFAEVYKSHPEWKLQLIGKVKDDDYSQNLCSLITHFNMEDAVSIMGEQDDVYYFLNKARIGVLASDSEGLPLAILEYAISGLPVVCTDVGYCKEVVRGFGKVVPPGDSKALAEALLFYIQNPDIADSDAESLQRHVQKTYTEQAVLPQVIEIYERLLQP